MNLPPHPTRTWRLWGVTFDWRLTQLVAISTLLLLIEFYNKIGGLAYNSYNRLFFLFVLPAAVIYLLWHEDLRTYALRWGDWRLGLPVTLAAIAVMAPIIWLLGQQPAFQAYYGKLLQDRPVWRIVVDEAFELFSWEFFCRGWLLYALARKYGTDAIWLQAVPFALMHLLKPEFETLTTVFGGVLFGLLAWRTRSFLYGWLIHWFMVVWMLLAVAGYI